MQEQPRNGTSVVRLGEFHLGPAIEEGMRMLQGRSYEYLDNDLFVFRHVAGEPLAAEEFEVEADFSPNDDEESDAFMAMKIVTGEIRYETRRHRVQFARKYAWKDGRFNVLVPQDTGIIYVVHILPRNNSFVQWHYHSHDEEKESILGNADYALFAKTPTEANPLLALVRGNEVFDTGKSGSGSTGNYREMPKEEMVRV